MKIYIIEHDPVYAAVEPKDPDQTLVNLDFQADELKEFLDPGFRLVDKQKKRGNFYFLNDTALVFDQIAFEAMSPFIDYSATPNNVGLHQLFDVQVDGVGTLYIKNMIEASNPVNKQASEWDPDNWKRTIEMGKLVFHRERVRSTNGLLKIPELNYRPLLVHTDVSNREHDFLICYHEKGLTGLMFREIWSG